MRLLLPLLVTGLLATGCAQARDAVGGATDCASLAADIARTGLDGVPTAAEAEQAVQRLDDRVQDLQDTEVREAAGTLRDRLRDLPEAARSTDPAAVQQAVAEAREAARGTAEACGLPADQFLG
ncbi:MAG: hypothetical protein M3P31_04105 [Actinomycetota bacterium]|nr:hypothetical protein [Actinomycetota bacterium]